MNENSKQMTALKYRLHYNVHDTRLTITDNERKLGVHLEGMGPVTKDFIEGLVFDANQLAALIAERDALRARVKILETVMERYANEDNWASHDGYMYLKTLSHPWSDARTILDRGK
jgi:hypothetical protein